jgi:hypothetical protein
MNNNDSTTFDPASYFVRPDWADADEELATTEYGDISAEWSARPHTAGDDDFCAAVVRMDIYELGGGFRSDQPSIELMLDGEWVNGQLDASRARSMAGALQEAAVELDRINAQASGRRTWEISNPYAAHVTHVWILEMTSADGTMTIESSSAHRPDDSGEEAVGDEWDSNHWRRKKDYSANPTRYRRIALAEIVTAYRGDDERRMALVAEIKEDEHTATKM